MPVLEGRCATLRRLARKLGAQCRSATILNALLPVPEPSPVRGLRTLAADMARTATRLAAAGRNVPVAAEATQRESDAVDAQKARWDQVRRMIRAAASGVPELSAKLSGC